jgi:ABC-type uncharacterized transport system involved in gliding motility auxiliary subunit
MKTTIVNLKYLRYLFWFSPILIVAGLTAAAIVGRWEMLPLALTIIGIAIAVVWLGYNSNSLPGFFGRRSTQVGTNALIATLAVLVILGLLNFLGVRYAVQLDLTENQIFTLAPQTVEVVQGLQEPVKAWIFDRVPDAQDRALLENYRQESSQFSYNYVDPEAQPGVTRRFGVQSPGDVYLEAGQERRFVQTVNPEERLSERKLTSAIAQISDLTQAKVYFVQGHGERSLEAGEGGLSEAIARLEEETYLVNPLNLAEAMEIPDDAGVIVIAGPQRDLLETEITALENYLERQSGVMLLLDPLLAPRTTTDAQPYPRLGQLLQKWGTAIDNLVIIDPAGQAAGLGAPVTIITEYGDHPITQEFNNGISLYPVAQPVATEAKEGIETTSLLITSDRTQGQRIGPDGQWQFNPATDPQGPLVLGAALSRSAGTAEVPSVDATDPSPSGNEPSDEAANSPESRLIIVGNSSFIINGLFNQQLNGDMFLNSIRWLSQQGEQPLSIRPKESTNRRILLSGQQQLLLTLVSLIVLPFLGFGMAIGVWWTRR